MTPERIAKIRKCFTTADIDDLCDEVLSLQTALVVQMEKYLAEKNLVIAQDIQIAKLDERIQAIDPDVFECELCGHSELCCAGCGAL